MQMGDTVIYTDMHGTQSPAIVIAVNGEGGSADVLNFTPAGHSVFRPRLKWGDGMGQIVPVAAAPIPDPPINLGE